VIGPLAGPLVEPSEGDPDVAEALRLRAAAFIRCGGSVTLSEWNSMSTAERAALEAAIEMVEEERVAARVRRALDAANEGGAG